VKGNDNMKKKKMTAYIVYLFIFVYIFNLIFNIKNPKVETTSATKKDTPYDFYSLGTIESIIEYGEHSVIAVHYPVFDEEKIDYIVKDMVQNEISNFKLMVEDESIHNNKNYKSELNIDYELYKGPKDIVSIKFIIFENTPYYANPKVELDTLVVDLKKDKEVALKNVFKGKFLEKLSSLSKEYFEEIEGYKEYVDTKEFKLGIKPNPNNFSNFLLGEDRIIIVFQRNQLFPGYLGPQIIEIPFTLLSEFLKKDFINSDLLEIFSSSKIIESGKKETADEEIKIPTDDIKQALAPSTRNIDPNKPMIALTFDDGPYPRATVSILNTLKKYNCVATFFVLGNRVPNYKNIIQRMADEGNEIGNHSYNHKQLTTLTPKELKDQINKTQKAVFDVVGSEPKALRPTYGSYDEKLRSAIGMPIILWSIDPQDWKIKDAKKISDHILARVKDGDIVLMHDIFEATAEAVETLVPELLNRGFQLVTVSELYELRGEALLVGNIYTHLRP
jgi:peptidoglycan/xylan/chitin deacetylase (PgdA/CDA1 family)